MAQKNFSQNGGELPNVFFFPHHWPSRFTPLHPWLPWLPPDGCGGMEECSQLAARGLSSATWVLMQVMLLLMAEILHQLRLVVYPIIYRVSYIPGGWEWDFNHQQ